MTLLQTYMSYCGHKYKILRNYYWLHYNIFVCLLADHNKHKFVTKPSHKYRKVFRISMQKTSLICGA